MTDCPCGSGKEYKLCCQPIIEEQLEAQTAEQLMRARYTAHTLADIEFVVNSHHPDTRAEIDQLTTKKWAEESTWLGINIIDVIGGTEQEQTGKIEFIANYRDNSGKRHSHHELSEFEKVDSKWFFKDASAPKIQQFRREQPKIGRNDPCFCGSGKKFKKCCA